MAGDVRPQGYVGDPNGWVGPLGLAACPNRPDGYQTHDADQYGLLGPQEDRVSGHTNTARDNRIQSHHPIQDAWAQRHVPGYNRNEAPAILLPSSSGISHARISAAQRAFRRQNGFDTDIRTEFNEAARQMRAAGVPEAQIRRVIGRAYRSFGGLRAFQMIRKDDLSDYFHVNPPATDDQITRAVAELGQPLPAAYVEVLKITDGLSCDGNLVLLEAQDIAQRNSDYEVQEYMPGYVMIGDDSGGVSVRGAGVISSPPAV